jgi:eukaryotic-like serine/threonine-protein kinase
MREWVVPGYTEVRELGSGGFGAVVLARRNVSDRLVAIKYLHQDRLVEDPVFVQMFRVEARVLASLDDPHVVRLYEYVESSAGAAIVMELVDGVSLREIVSRQGKTSAEAALVVLQGSLLGLAAAHARGVVHRDYKPENVLVDGTGASKLTDFGIAARSGDRPVPAGTLAYAPPEQFGGSRASPAGDVYAATATFYECLVGHPPFSGDTAQALLYQHLSAPVPLDPVPEPLRPLVTAGMAKDPAGRPADAALLVAELRAAAWPAYGQDWEDRGRSHLGEAALLLAALWPSGAPPAVQGHAVQQVQLSQGPEPKPGSAHAAHLEHLRHLEHVEHLEREHVEHLEHLQHAQHLEHLSHLENAEHVEHLEHAEHLGQHSQSPPGPQGTGTPAAAAKAASADVPVSAGTGVAAAGTAATGAAAATAATPRFPGPLPPPGPPPATRLQSLVRNVSQSDRVPRRLRRALPHDPSAGTAAAIVGAAAATVVVIIAVIAVMAGALTSSSPTPQAGLGNSTPAAAGTATGGAGTQDIHIGKTYFIYLFGGGTANITLDQMVVGAQLIHPAVVPSGSVVYGFEFTIQGVSGSESLPMANTFDSEGPDGVDGNGLDSSEIVGTPESFNDTADISPGSAVTGWVWYSYQSGIKPAWIAFQVASLTVASLDTSDANPMWYFGSNGLPTSPPSLP